VALGTIAAAEMSAALGMCAVRLPVRVRWMVERWAFRKHPSTPGRAGAMGTDKRRGRALRFVSQCAGR
jgi:hypothetical protein